MHGRYQPVDFAGGIGADTGVAEVVVDIVHRDNLAHTQQFHVGGHQFGFRLLGQPPHPAKVGAVGGLRGDQGVVTAFDKVKFIAPVGPSHRRKRLAVAFIFQPHRHSFNG